MAAAQLLAIAAATADQFQPVAAEADPMEAVDNTAAPQAAGSSAMHAADEGSEGSAEGGFDDGQTREEAPPPLRPSMHRQETDKTKVHQHARAD